VVFEEDELFIEARWAELRVLGSFETFEAADGFVNASIH